MKTYKIQDREAGNVIETGLSLNEAKRQLSKFEEQDKKDGYFTPDFYEIKELTQIERYEHIKNLCLKLKDSISNDICDLSNEMDYKEGSAFSFNSDRLDAFIKGIVESEKLFS